MADAVRIELALEAVDNTGQVIDNIIGSLQKMKEAAEKSSGPLDKTSEKVTKFGVQAGKTPKLSLSITSRHKRPKRLCKAG